MENTLSDSEEDEDENEDGDNGEATEQGLESARPHVRYRTMDAYEKYLYPSTIALPCC